MAFYEPIRYHDCQRQPCELRVVATRSHGRTRFPVSGSATDPVLANGALYQSSEPLICRNYAPNPVCNVGNTTLLAQMRYQDALQKRDPLFGLR
jgi:hypothetical protein